MFLSKIKLKRIDDVLDVESYFFQQELLEQVASIEETDTKT